MSINFAKFNQMIENFIYKINDMRFFSVLYGAGKITDRSRADPG